jgi:hypothetical protein
MHGQKNIKLYYTRVLVFQINITLLENMYSKYTEGLVGEVIYPFFYFSLQFYAGGSKVGLSALTSFFPPEHQIS